MSGHVQTPYGVELVVSVIVNGYDPRDAEANAVAAVRHYLDRADILRVTHVDSLTDPVEAEVAS